MLGEAGNSQCWEGEGQGCGHQRKHMTQSRKALGKALEEVTFRPRPEYYNNNVNYYLK